MIRIDCDNTQRGASASQPKMWDEMWDNASFGKKHGFGGINCGIFLISKITLLILLCYFQIFESPKRTIHQFPLRTVKLAL